MRIALSDDVTSLFYGIPLTATFHFVGNKVCGIFEDVLSIMGRVSCQYFEGPSLVAASVH